MRISRRLGLVGAAAASTTAALVATAAPALAYDRNAATQYEDNYCGAGPCPSSRNTDYEYFSNDCTNFVSQGLRAGGLPFVGMNGPYSDSNNKRNWWDLTAVEAYINRPIDQSSGSARIAQDLYDHLTQMGSGRGVTVGQYWLGPAQNPAPAEPANMENGDIYFYDWQSDGHIEHAGMKVGVGNSNYQGWYGDYVDSHTTNRYHLQWTMTEVNPDWQTTTAWAVHING